MSLESTLKDVMVEQYQCEGSAEVYGMRCYINRPLSCRGREKAMVGSFCYYVIHNHSSRLYSGASLISDRKCPD